MGETLFRIIQPLVGAASNVALLCLTILYVASKKQSSSRKSDLPKATHGVCHGDGFLLQREENGLS